MFTPMATHEDMLIRHAENAWFVTIPEANIKSERIIHAFVTQEEAEDFLTMFETDDDED